MSTKVIKKLKHSGDWIAQTEAARLRKVSPAAISLLLRRERLRSKVVNGRKMVNREDVITFESGVGGRPSKNVMQAAVASVNRDEWITQKEAAQLRGTTIHAIKWAINNGRIRTLKKEGVLFVMKKDVLNYKPRIDFHPESGPQSALPRGANPEEWITVAEAARIREVSESMITTHATQKRVRSIKTGDTRLIYREDIVNFKRKPRTSRSKKK